EEAPEVADASRRGGIVALETPAESAQPRRGEALPLDPLEQAREPTQLADPPIESANGLSETAVDAGQEGHLESDGRRADGAGDRYESAGGEGRDGEGCEARSGDRDPARCEIVARPAPADEGSWIVAGLERSRCDPERFPQVQTRRELSHGDLALENLR